MKNIFKTMLPILAMAACVWASCSDDKDDPTPGKPALPTIAVSEPALSADNAKAVVTVTPSEETEKWYWKCEPKGQSAAAYTAVTGKEFGVFQNTPTLKVLRILTKQYAALQH